MKKIILTAVALAFSAGMAAAENPNVGTPDDLYTHERTVTPKAAPFKVKLGADGFEVPPAGSNR